MTAPLRRLAPRQALGLLVLAVGCKGCQDSTALPNLLEAEDATPVGVWVGEGLGTSPVTVPVFATTGLGAAVPVDAITVTSDGTTVASVTPGADGWASVDVSGTGPGRYGVEATVASAVADGAAFQLDTTLGRLDMPGIAAGGTPTALASAAGGVAWAIDGDVWWAAWGGAPAVRVLSLGEPVVGLRSAEIDSDGVTDLVVWSADRVIALRGHDGGGLTWGGGWSPTEGRTVAGVAVADADGDAHTDLALALTGTDGAYVGVLGGDGAWAFTLTDALELGYPIDGVSVEDLDQNGILEVTVLTADGLLRRYTKLDGDWVATLTGSQYALSIGAGSILDSTSDLTGDGVPEIVAYGPSLDGGGMQAWIVTAGADVPAQYQLIGDEARPDVLGVALGDLTGDGVDDIALSMSGELTRGRWSIPDDRPTLSAFASAPVSAAFALDDIDGDGVLDAIVGGETIRGIYGAHTDPAAGDTGDTAADTSVTEWTYRVPSSTVFGLDLVAEPAVQDVDGDGIVDLVALVGASGTTGVAIQGFAGVPATDTTKETLRSGGAITLSGAGSPVDLAVCGTRAYVLYDETDDTGTVGTWLVRADLTGKVVPSLDGAPLAVTGSHLACGTFALGEVAVADDAGAVTFVDAAGTASPGEAIGAVGAMTAVDTDGDGLDELVACAEAGCYVAAADLDGDGVSDLAVQDSTGVTVTLGGAAVTFDPAGALRVQDADGDGRRDLVVGESGAATVFRALSGSVTPGVSSWTWRPVEDAVHYGDLDGDGIPDAFLLGRDPDPDDAAGSASDQWIGTLVYAHATAAE